MLNVDKVVEYALTKHRMRLERDDPILSLCVFHEAVMEQYNEQFQKGVLELDRRIEVVTQSYRDCAQEYAEDILEQSLGKIIGRTYEQKELMEDAFSKSVSQVDAAVVRLNDRLEKIEKELLYARLFCVGSVLIFLSVCFVLYMGVRQ